MNYFYISNKKNNKMKKWYQELFENYADTYDKECFTQGTIGECDFIEKEIDFDKSKKIIDIACGTGRHSVELAKRGYKVTGIDLSESQLEKAWKKAVESGVVVDFQQMDARNILFSGEFELALMICEGAFSLMETDDMNFEILKNAAKTLKPGGKLIMTTLSALYPLFHSVKEFMDSHNEKSEYDVLAFDLMTFREKNTLTYTDDSETKKTLSCEERYYTPSEMTWLLKTAGFGKVEIFGCKLGAYSREDKLTTEDFEMLIVAEKS